MLPFVINGVLMVKNVILIQKVVIVMQLLVTIKAYVVFLLAKKLEIVAQVADLSWGVEGEKKNVKFGAAMLQGHRLIVQPFVFILLLVPMKIVLNQNQEIMFVGDVLPLRVAVLLVEE